MVIRDGGSDDEGEVEFLDVGGASPGRAGPGRPRRRWWLLALAAVVLAAVGFGITRTSSHGPPSARGSTSHSRPPAVTASNEASPALAQPPTSVRRPTVTVVGHPLLGEAGDWELVARGPSGLVRIQLGRGQVMTTRVPDLVSGGDVSFIVGSDRVLIRPLDFVPGYVVRDGRPAQELPRSLARGPILPGPRADQIWVPTGVGAVGTPDSVRALGLDGHSEGESIALPSGVQSSLLSPDGAGGLAFEGVGGYYQLRPRGWYRITTGIPLAVGPTRMLVEECDSRYRCEDVVIRQQDGARLRSLPPQPRGYAQFGAGIISPDGRRAAIPRLDENGSNAIRLVDLVSGAARNTLLTLNAQADAAAGTLAWSPDSRWLFAVSGGGNIVALDVRSGRLHGLGVTLPTVAQLGIRRRG